MENLVFTCDIQTLVTLASCFSGLLIGTFFMAMFGVIVATYALRLLSELFSFLKDRKEKKRKEVEG